MTGSSRRARFRWGIANEKPYGFVETGSKLVGAVPDVIFAVLDPLGLKDMKAEIVEFNALIPGINANASTSSAPACTSARNDARRLPSQIPSLGALDTCLNHVRSPEQERNTTGKVDERD